MSKTGFNNKRIEFCVGCLTREQLKSRKLHTLSDDSIHYALIQGNIYVPENSRACRIDIDESGLIKQDHIDQISVISQETCLDKEKAEKILKRFLKFGRRNTLFSKFSDEVSITESLWKNNTGLSKIQFYEQVESLGDMNEKIAKELFAKSETHLNLICDGTYCRIQKSSNYTFQRLLFSGQKKYNFVKPFVVTTTNGRIVDIFGLHPAGKNDATILKEILEDKKNGLRDFLQENDILIFDRGLWVVEVKNSFLKRSFRAIESISNAELNHTLVDYKIAAALINKYFKFVFSYNENIEIARKMKLKISKSNDLCKIVIDNKLHKKSNFEKIEYAEINDFPILTIDKIKNEISYGNYQIIQAKSYNIFQQMVKMK
ncbi:unnamed protein product [Brachionus calyciflorus]|uniref:DDE Tnp4 domain-containing protein n=1 Tax=Brachionus calyciflorus TaxID=104777 RepID=A0A813S7N2_9BILA|nr:unnamed protein product [Brachionus calyciflorus]